MLLNPFTPSEIASHPEDFFGRSHELRILERSLKLGSVAISGAVGIGKSSLLSRIRLLMEGFASDHKAISFVTVGDKDTQTVDQAARLILEAFTTIDEASKKIKISFPKVVEFEAAEVCRQFAEGRHLAALKRLMEKEYLNLVLNEKEYLLLAVDEADKCTVALARLIRSLTTHIQQIGVKRVRFLLAGVSPYFRTMVREDPGINRFFYKVLTLQPMEPDEAADLVSTKLQKVVKKASDAHIEINIDPSVIDRVVNLSGGHPHILQLLGSHLVEHENEDPDGVIDARDLVSSLRAICYEDRAHVYDATLHTLDLQNQADSLRNLIAIAPRTFPTRIDRARADLRVGKESLEWLVSNNILRPLDSFTYGLVDEFLRVRLLLDDDAAEAEETEKEMISLSAAEGIKGEELVFDDRFPPGSGQYLPSQEDSEESSSSEETSEEDDK